MKQRLLTILSFLILQTNAQLCFESVVNYSVGAGTEGIITADFNGDGYPDLANTNNNVNSISILLGDGTGTFGTPSYFNVNNTPNSLFAADFNADGKLDLAVANEGDTVVSILLGTGTGSFGLSTPFIVGYSPYSIISNDFNSDGKADIATANIISDNVSILLGNGTGSFSPVTNFSVGSFPTSIISGDFNGDAKLDIATANSSSNGVSILLGTGTGSFSNAVTIPVAGWGPNSVCTADFNGDGKLDLATANLNSSNVCILLGNGLGGFISPTTFSATGYPELILSGDYDGDGKLDLSMASGTVVDILLGNGLGGFGSCYAYTVSNQPEAIISGDFNLDGKSDFATANALSSDLSVLLHCTYGPSSLTAVYQASLINLVTWLDNSQIETGFELWGNSGAALTYSLLTTLPANSMSYLHSNLSYTTNYCYKVRAVNSSGPGTFSNIDCASTPADTTNTTLVNELSLRNSFEMYPNPTSGNLIISFSGSAQLNISDYNITDNLGQINREKEIDHKNPSFIITTSDLANGLYQIHFKTQLGTITKKFVKTN